MRVSKWGNSLAIRLPMPVVASLKIKDGDDIDIHVENSRSFTIAKSADSKELLRRLRRFRGKLPKGFKFDRLEAHEQKDFC